MKCAIYCRVSTEEQALGGHSIEAQRQELIKYCYTFGYEIYDFYIDAGFSASTMERPALKNLLENSKNFDIALVWRLDRISRDMPDLMKILEVFANNNVAFKSKTENFDTSTPSGKLMLNMLGSFAEFERASISERIKMAHRKILNEGKWRGGKPPFGYKLSEDKRLEILEDEACIVRKIFDMSANKNIGTRTISVELNRLGYTTRKDKPFSSSYIVKILSNPTYFGQMVHGRQNYIKKDGKKQVVYNKDFETYSGLFEPIISEETFLLSKDNLDKRKQNRGFSSAIPNILGGLVFCGTCKDYMLRNNTKDGKAFFVCRRYKHYGECSHHYVSENRILKEIKKCTENLKYNRDGILKIHERYDKQAKTRLNDIVRQIKELEKQAKSFILRENKLFELIEKGLITEEEFVKRKKVLFDEQSVVIAALQEARYKKKTIDSQQENMVFVRDMKSFNQEFERLSPAKQKAVLNKLIARIEILENKRAYAKRKVHIYFSI